MVAEITVENRASWSRALSSTGGEKVPWCQRVAKVRKLEPRSSAWNTTMALPSPAVGPSLPAQSQANATLIVRFALIESGDKPPPSGARLFEATDDAWTSSCASPPTMVVFLEPQPMAETRTIPNDAAEPRMTCLSTCTLPAGGHTLP